MIGGKVRLRAQKVRFEYRGLPVLREVSIEVAPREILGIVGPNGAGKTTLLKILSGTLKPAGGIVELDAQELRRFSAKERARRIAMLQQDPTIPPGLTVEQIVLMGRYPYLGFFGQERREDLDSVGEAMTMTDVECFRERALRTLSGGEKSRALLARALAQEPELLLLDEPTAHLDVGRRSELFHLVKRVRGKRGISVVAAIHDLSLAARHCDRLALLHKGRIHACGEPGKVLTQTILREVFGPGVLVTAHPVDGGPVVVWE